MMRQSLGNRLATLKSAAIEAGLAFFDAFEKQIPGGIDAATEAIRNFDVSHMVAQIKSVGSFFKTWKNSILTITALIGGLTLAQKAFNLAVSANPYIIIATGMAAWIKAMEDIRREWKFLREEFPLWEKFASFITKSDRWMEQNITYQNLAALGAGAGTGSGYAGAGLVPPVTAPNRAAVERQRQRDRLDGNITFNNPPPGIESDFTFNDQTIDTTGLGPNK